MKIFSGPLVIIFLSILLLSGCNGKKTPKKDIQNAVDTVTVPDTGYTGIKQYLSNKVLVKEVTFKNGVREGLMKSFYPTGQTRQTFLYSNGLREDSAKWYYIEGQVFRSTPYFHDTVDGIQKQYYRTGKLKAMLGYKKGFRTPYLEEFAMDGKLVTGYPQLIVNVQDDYKSKGIYKITLSLSEKSAKVNFYLGDFSNGVFDTTRCKKINTIKGTGIIILKKTGSPKKDFVGVIGEILTNFGNNCLQYKKIGLPYNDLN